MGLATCHMRLVYLKTYESQLQFKIGELTQTKLYLMSTVNELEDVGTDLKEDSPELKVLKSREKKLKLTEQKLDMQLEKYKTLLNAVSTEKESAQKFVNSSAQSAFSYGR